MLIFSSSFCPVYYPRVPGISQLSSIEAKLNWWVSCVGVLYTGGGAFACLSWHLGIPPPQLSPCLLFPVFSLYFSYTHVYTCLQYVLFIGFRSAVARVCGPGYLANSARNFLMSGTSFVFTPIMYKVLQKCRGKKLITKFSNLSCLSSVRCFTFVSSIKTDLRIKQLCRLSEIFPCGEAHGVEPVLVRPGHQHLCRKRGRHHAAGALGPRT